GDLHLPAGLLELIVDEAGAVHRLDRRPHRLIETSDPPGKTTKTIGVRRRRARLHRLTLLVKQVKVETLAAELQPGVQHCGAPLRLVEDARSMTPREALLHRIPFGSAPTTVRGLPPGK